MLLEGILGWECAAIVAFSSVGSMGRSLWHMCVPWGLPWCYSHLHARNYM